MVLQYVGDILIVGEIREGDLQTCQEATRDPQELSQLSYQVSAKKVQLCQLEVTYLGYIFKGGWPMHAVRLPQIKPSLASWSHQPKGRTGWDLQGFVDFGCQGSLREPNWYMRPIRAKKTK